MAAPNHLTDTDNAPHQSGAPVDPFAVDFFGGTHLAEDETAPATAAPARNRLRRRKKSDWHKILPHVSNSEAEFSNLLTALPENLSEKAAAVIAGALARYTFQPAAEVGCSVITVTEANLAEALRRTEEPANVFLTFAVEPAETRALAACRFDFAARLIDAVLDGQFAAPRDERGLSPVETAIIEFLTAGIIAEINKFLGAPALALQSIGSAPPVRFETNERGAEAVLELRAGELRGIVRFFAPQKFLRSLDRSQNALFGRKSEGRRLSDYEKIARRLDLRLLVGTTRLDADSLGFLEPEDIVLIDRPLIDLRAGELLGALQVTAGSGTNFRLRGAPETDSRGNLQIRIEEITSEEARRRFAPAKFIMDEMENDLAENSDNENDSPGSGQQTESYSEESIAPALENVQVALRVEIAGSKISLRELQNLRAGQIIALGVTPNDPVRLVTDNNEEPIAAGELVDIEGQLGVRLTKVFI